MDTRLKAAFFIDGANLYATAKALDINIDFKRFRKLWEDELRVIRAFYYTALLESSEYQSIKPLIDWLDYNGYQVVSKSAKEYVDAHGARKIKGNMDCEMIIDMVKLAPSVDVMVLFTGDGDFSYAVEHIQSLGVEVRVVSTIATNPYMIADDLRRMADQFIDLVRLKDVLHRDHEHGGLKVSSQRR